MSLTLGTHYYILFPGFFQHFFLKGKVGKLEVFYFFFSFFKK